jgi:hypothetical protein
MTETETALQQAGADASQALLGLGGSMDKADATTPELTAEQESPASYEDPLDNNANMNHALSLLRPDSDTNHPNPHDNITTPVSDEDQPVAAVAATAAAVAASRPRSGILRRKAAKRTFGSPLFSPKPPPPPAPPAVAPAPFPYPSSNTKNDNDEDDDCDYYFSSPSLQLFRESAALTEYARPLTETAAIIESEMGGTSLEDLDMAAPMLLYSLSTSSTRNYNRKRKQRELQDQKLAAAAEEHSNNNIINNNNNADTSKQPLFSLPVPVAKKPTLTPERKQKQAPVPPEDKAVNKRKRTISRKKQESMVSATAGASGTTGTATKISAAAARKKGAAAGAPKKRSYVKRAQATLPLTLAPAAPAAKPVQSPPVQGNPLFAPKGPVIMPEMRYDVQIPWAMVGEIFPKLNPNDVLSGRGNGVAIYPGNRQFREYIRMFKEQYVRAYRNEKGNVAADVIRTILSLNPPGRFVEKAKGGHGYQLVDYARALEKTSQALREGSAELRSIVHKSRVKFVLKEESPDTNTVTAVKAKDKTKAKSKSPDKVKEKSKSPDKVKEKAKSPDKVKEKAKSQDRVN